MDPREHIDKIEIELSTRCVIGCPACPRALQDRNMQWDTGFMDIDVLKDVVENTNYKSYIFCGAYGDAIYHPQIIDIIKYMLPQRNKKWFLETNGSHKSPEFWDEVAQLEWRGRCGFIFSIDGLDDTNHIYRKRSDWDSIMYGVEKMLDKPRHQRPRMKWKYLVFPYNEHQVADAKALSDKLGFDEFVAVKSLRKYKDWYFENDQERRNIDWNFT